MRFLLFALASVSLAAQSPQPPGLSPFQLQKAREMLREKLPCLGCHELAGDGGRSAASLTTVTQRRSSGYIRAIVEDPQRVAPGLAMPKIQMPAATRELIVRYLSQGAATDAGRDSNAVQRTQRSALGPAALYGLWCSS